MNWSSMLRSLGLVLAGLLLGGLTTHRLVAPTAPPLPAAASPEVQAAIDSAQRIPVAVMRALRPDGEAQWNKLISERAAQSTSVAEIQAQTNTTIEKGELAGVPVYWITPAGHSDAKGLFLFLHGGAYVFGGGESAAREAALVAAYTGLKTVSIDYRMPPEHPHPAAVEDTVSVYRALLERSPAGQIALGGTSAGAGLSMAAVHRFKTLELPLPAALYLGTPWADLTKTGDSLYTLEGIDRVLVTYDGVLGAAAEIYANGSSLYDPLLSPVYGEFEHFPPTYLVTGTRDMFLSDTVRVHRKLKLAGVTTELNVFEGISHAGYAMAPGAPEFEQNYSEMAAFVLAHLGIKPRR